MLLCGFLYLFVGILSSDLRQKIIFSHKTKYLLMIHGKSGTNEIHSNPSISMFSFVFEY